MTKRKKLSAYRKSLAALVGAVVITIPLLTDGVTNPETVSIVVAFATAFGVYQAPNTD